jgi:hypothetical protein
MGVQVNFYPVVDVNNKVKIVDKYADNILGEAFDALKTLEPSPGAGFGETRADVILPDVLVKGGDWSLEQIVGREEVEASGGRVVSVPYEEGHSSSAVIQRILKRYRESS